MAATSLVFKQTQSLWADRFSKNNEGAADVVKIESIINRAIKPTDFYPIGMDFGCGRGRFVSSFAQHCGHIYVADIVPEAVEVARAIVPTSSGLKLSWPPEIPWIKPRLDLFWSFFTFQHIVDDGIFETFASELLRVMRPGCRILLLENAVDSAWHIKARALQVLSRALGMRSGFTAERVDVGSGRRDHWFIDGMRG